MFALFGSMWRYIANRYDASSNLFLRVTTFVLKDFPAYFWTKPSIWRLLLFPLLLWRVWRKPMPKHDEKNNDSRG